MRRPEAAGVRVREDVLLALGCVRIASAAQLVRVARGGSPAYVRRALRVLLDEGMVGRGRVGPGWVWHLTRRGQRAVADTGLLPPRPGASTGAAAVAARLARHALLVTEIGVVCVEAGLAPLSGLQVEVDHSVDGHRLVTDLVVTLHSGRTRMYEADRGTMAGHRLTAKLAAYARYATHTIHVGPRHLVGYTEHYWRRRYTGDRFPDVTFVFDGLPPEPLERRIDRLDQDARRIRAVRDGTLPAWATTLAKLRASPNTGRALGDQG